MTQIEFYQPADGAVSLEVRADGDTVWLSQQQIAALFETTQQNVSLHLLNVYEEGELDEAATHKDFLSVRQEGSRSVRRAVAHYNLDAILSVGYRVKSNVATQFRVWATATLRDYLVQGYAIDEQRLEQLGSIVSILARSSDELVAGVADVLADYLPGLTLLRDYDEGTIDTQPAALPGWELTIDEARAVIAQVAQQFPTDALIGKERGGGLAGVVATIYQGFGGQDLYPTVEEKAANLLYLIVKDHPLSDGNKRSAAALFVTFLARNVYLDLYAEFRRAADAEKESINDDVVFEIELIKQVEINVDYILMLVQRHRDADGDGDDEEIRATITRAIDSSPSLRNKKDLIEAFVDDLSADGEIDAEWRAFVAARRAAELETIIEAEGLRPEETRAFVETGFRDGALRTTGTAITKVLPPVSRFAAGGGHADKKQRVIARLGEFFERFLGLG